MFVVTSVVLIALATAILWFSPWRIAERLGFRSFFGAALLAAWLAAIGASLLERNFAHGAPGPDAGLADAMRALGPVDWSGDNRRDGTSSSAAPDIGGVNASGTGGTMSVASVQSLIGGLQARLENGPADADGWALLAQSYAFVGRMEQAEAAVSRAVELGFDEDSLRARVGGAARDAHPRGNWIEQTLSR